MLLTMKEVLAVSSSSPGPLLTVRAALVLLTASVVGLVAGGLAFLAHRDAATAVLIGGGAAGGALALFHGLIAADRGAEETDPARLPAGGAPDREQPRGGDDGQRRR